MQSKPSYDVSDKCLFAVAILTWLYHRCKPAHYLLMILLRLNNRFTDVRIVIEALKLDK